MEAARRVCTNRRGCSSSGKGRGAALSCLHRHAVRGGAGRRWASKREGIDTPGSIMDDGRVVRIHGYLVSTWTRTACMTCLEKGAEYELVPVAYRGAEHFAMHPFGRMPVLEADGLLIPEGLAVMGYLDETLPGPALQPADAAARARMRTWMSICGDYVFRDVVRGIPRDREPTDEELTAARTVLERIEPMVDNGEFLVGE